MASSSQILARSWVGIISSNTGPKRCKVQLRYLTTARQYSQSPLLRGQPAKTSQQPPSNSGSKAAKDNSALPSFSFEGLGASRRLKIILYTCLGLLCIPETIFYSKWIYHYFYPMEAKAVVEDGDGTAPTDVELVK